MWVLNFELNGVGYITINYRIIKMLMLPVFKVKNKKNLCAAVVLNNLVNKLDFCFCLPYSPFQPWNKISHWNHDWVPCRVTSAIGSSQKEILARLPPIWHHRKVLALLWESELSRHWKCQRLQTPWVSFLMECVLVCFTEGNSVLLFFVVFLFLFLTAT